MDGYGTVNPLAFFGNHQLIIIKKGTQKGLFDPSYGTSATNLTDYAVKSFDFVGSLTLLGKDPMTGVKSWKMTLTPVTAANAKNLLIGN